MPVKESTLQKEQTIFASVPQHWTVKKLGYLASLKSGEGITTDAIGEQGAYPVYGGNGLRGYSDSYTHDGEYVLIGRQGALCGNINYADGKFWASEHAVVVTPQENCDIKWLGETLRAMDLNQYSVSAAQPGISVDRISSIKIAVPPIEEQRQISKFIDRETAEIDALVAEKERMLALLEEKRQALISHIVTRGLDPNAPLKPSGLPWLGDIPQHWDIRRLKFVADVQTGLTLGKTYTEKDLARCPYLRVANVQDGFLDLSQITEIEIPRRDVSRYQLKYGDVLMTEGGDFDKLGRGYVWESQIENCLHQNHIYAVRPHTEYLEPHFLAILMTSHYGKAYFTSISRQTTNLATINQTNLLNLFLPIPPVSEQKEIVAHLAKISSDSENLLTSIQTSIALLKERRSALITAAVTGQIPLEDMAA